MNGSLHPKLCNIDFHNVAHFLVSWNSRERIFCSSNFTPYCHIFSLISWNLSLMQTIKEVNPHPYIAPCVDMWSVTFFFFFLCHLLYVGACVCHIAQEAHEVDHTSVGDRKTYSKCPHISFVLFHNVTCYTDSIASRIHVDTIKLRNTKCTLVATSVIQRGLECTNKGRF
jgi:hypothetical protein